MQFYGYQYAYESWGSEDVINVFTLIASLLWAYSNFNNIVIILDLFAGKYKPLPFFKQLLMMIYLQYEPYKIILYNFEYMLRRFMALTLTALIMSSTYSNFLWYKLWRGSTFNYDFEQIEKDGYILSIKQGLVWHYFGSTNENTERGWEF